MCFVGAAEPMAKQNALTSLLNEGEIKPSQRRSLSEETADKLRELILLEKLPPGMHMPERDLAEVLGISRTPMREVAAIATSSSRMVRIAWRLTSWRRTIRLLPPRSIRIME